MIATFSNPCTRCTNTLREYGEKKKKKKHTNQFCCARLAGSAILMKSNCIRWQIKAKSSFSGTRRSLCVMATNVFLLFFLSFYLWFSLCVLHFINFLKSRLRTQVNDAYCKSFAFQFFLRDLKKKQSHT